VKIMTDGNYTCDFAFKVYKVCRESMLKFGKGFSKRDVNVARTAAKYFDEFTCVGVARYRLQKMTGEYTRNPRPLHEALKDANQKIWDLLAQTKKSEPEILANYNPDPELFGGFQVEYALSKKSQLFADTFERKYIVASVQGQKQLIAYFRLKRERANRT